jgi:hypothetical protein
MSDRIAAIKKMKNFFMKDHLLSENLIVGALQPQNDYMSRINRTS